MSSSVFDISGLSFAYDARTKVFEGIDLRIREGAITALIGANGSGKTTLFNLMTKNLKPDEGKVLLRGVDIAELRLRDFSRLVAIVHQQNIAPDDLTVRKLVEYGRYVHRSVKHPRMAQMKQMKEDPSYTPRSHRQIAEDRRTEDQGAVQMAMDLTDVAELADQPISALSGGQRQRVWIAMAIAQGSKVLLLDEPTTYLDLRYQLEILNLVRHLHEQLCMTVVMVLHDVNQAIYYSDEIVALADGQVVAQGEPESIVTPELIERVYGIDLDVIDLEGHPFVLNVENPSSAY